MGNKSKGYILAAIAAAAYGTNPLFALPLYQCGMNPDSVLFFRYLSAVPILGIMLKLRGHDFKLHKNEIVPLVIMGIIVAISSLALFVAYNYMEAGIASTILFVYPIMVAVIMAAIYHEKLTLQTILCIIMALGGIILLYDGGEEGATLSLTGTLIVLGAAFAYSLYIVGINRPIFKHMPTLKVTFYVLLFGVSVFVARFAAGEELVLPDSGQWYLWGNVLGLAVVPTAISFICTTLAVQYIGSTPTAILGALEPATAIVIGVAVFGEQLTGRESFGLFMIIIAVTAVVAGGNLPQYMMRFRKMFPRALRHKQKDEEKAER